MVMSNETWIPPVVPSANLQCLIEYIEAVNAGDMPRMLATFHESFQIQILPRSLQRPKMGLEEYKEYFPSMSGLVRGFKVTIHEVVESASEDKIMFHASSTGAASDGTPYANEYAIIMRFLPAGDGTPRIAFSKEFVDSLFSTTFFRGEREKLAAKAGET